MIRRAVVVAAVLGLPLSAACGESSPSKQDYLAEVDPICQRGNEIAAVFTTPSDLAMMKDFATKLADNLAKTAGEVDKLGKPGGDDGQAAEDMVRSMRDAAAAARGIGPEVDKGSFPGIEAAVAKAVDAVKAADAKARALGSAECGKGEAAAAAKLGETSGAAVKNAYIAKVDAICKATNAQFEAIAEPQGFAEVKPYLDQSIAVIDKFIADVKAIPPASVDKAKLDEFVGANETAVAKLKEAAAAAGTGDEERTVALLDEATVLGDSANVKADVYGSKECGTQGG